MTDLNSLLASKASLKRVVERYRAKLALAQRELDEIEDVLSTMKKYGVDISGDTNIGITPKTVGDMALELLKEYPEGLTSSQILHLIRERWMPELMRSSISPPLSRLKHMNMVELDGPIWRLTQQSSRGDVTKYRNHLMHTSAEAQEIVTQAFQVIIERQKEILSEIIENSSSNTKDAMHKIALEDRMASGAELIREAYEKTVNGCREAEQIDNNHNSLYTSWTALASPSSHSSNLPSGISSSEHRIGDYRRKRAL